MNDRPIALGAVANAYRIGDGLLMRVWRYCLRRARTSGRASEAARTVPHRYFLLYRDGPRVRAADGTILMEGPSLPARISLAGRDYGRASNDEIPWFWDELRDGRGATVGFELPAAADDPLLAPLYDGARNVEIAKECEHPQWECVQGFCCAVYSSESLEPGALLLMLDFSENRIAFDLDSLQIARSGL